MEEEKAAAYYEELNRKGEGARRFKQGLGFSSGEPQPAAFTSKPTTSSSFLSGFVRAGAAPAHTPKPTRPPPPAETAPRQRRRSRSPSPSRPRPRSRSRSPSRTRPRRSRSRSRSREPRRRSRSREREDRRASRYRSRSRSPSRRSGRNSHDEPRRDRHGDRRRDDSRQKGHGGRDGGKVDYSRLIQGYDKMTPAERVKAKMKLQLSETASKDSTLGTATVGWGRFEFNKDAPLDEDDNDVEGANDDASLVKHIGKSFRLSALESKNENTVRDAHDEAMFGVPMSSNLDTQASEDELKTNDDEGKKARDVDDQSGSSLISPEVLAMQKGSWRDRIQKLRQNSNT
ncbi:serine/arginine repetitive matrix protein 1 [Lolium rigidum]|uniref:serine/arginine repetitive matrix protein 1 n=1 Tax=Lolium rigidum TaxID=89674 RepID=UPI001F5C61F3|nr:serine/arginine repetitive matrix protein 1 [Lolium rigidum]